MTLSWVAPGGTIAGAGRRAAALLRGTLRGGVAPASVVARVAKRAWIGWRTMHTVKKRLGIRSVRVGGRWWWVWPEAVPS